MTSTIKQLSVCLCVFMGVCDTPTHPPFHPGDRRPGLLPWLVDVAGLSGRGSWRSERWAAESSDPGPPSLCRRGLSPSPPWSRGFGLRWWLAEVWLGLGLCGPTPWAASSRLLPPSSAGLHCAGKGLVHVRCWRPVRPRTALLCPKLFGEAPLWGPV